MRKKSKYTPERSRPLFADVPNVTTKKKKKLPFSIRLHNALCSFGSLFVRIALTLILSVAVSLFATAIMTSITNNIALDESISIIFKKVKDLL